VWGGGGAHRHLTIDSGREKGTDFFHWSEAPSRLARSCCPARARSGTCTATHLHCPLYPLPRGTTPAAARIECSLAIGLPAQGGERTLLSGAQRGSVGAEGGDQGGGGSPDRRFCIDGQVQQQQPTPDDRSPATRFRWQRRRGLAGRTCRTALEPLDVESWPRFLKEFLKLLYKDRQNSTARKGSKTAFSAVLSTEGRVVGPCWEKLKPKGPKKACDPKGSMAFLQNNFRCPPML